MVISYDNYIKKHLKRFNINEAKPIDTPIIMSSKLDVD